MTNMLSLSNVTHAKFETKYFSEIVRMIIINKYFTHCYIYIHLIHTTVHVQQNG